MMKVRVNAAVQQWNATLEAVGSVAPVQGVTLSADLPGVVDRVVFQSGAYGFTASPTAFLGHPPPVEVLV